MRIRYAVLRLPAETLSNCAAVLVIPRWQLTRRLSGSHSTSNPNEGESGFSARP